MTTVPKLKEKRSIKLPEAYCTNCGRLLGLLPAGYYCMKCDILLDKETLVEVGPTERRAAWLLPEKKLVWLEPGKDHLRIGDLTVPIHSIGLVKSTGKKINITGTTDSVASAFFGGGILAAASVQLVDEVEIRYMTEAGLATSLRLGLGDVGFLIKQLELASEPFTSCRNCRSMMHMAVKFCPECGARL